MPIGTWGEETNRIMRETRESRNAAFRHFTRSERVRFERTPEVQKILAAIAYIDVMIAQARVVLGLYPIQRRRGPKPALHPLPRREPRSKSDAYHEESHKRDHRDAYILGCQRCYVREYLYFRNHPEERPVGVWTAGTDDQGRHLKSRIYQPGWDPGKYPFKA